MKPRRQLNAVTAMAILILLVIAASQSQCNSSPPPNADKSEPAARSSTPDNSPVRDDPVIQDPVATERSQELMGEVIAIADGDSFTIRDSDRRTHRVRLEGIDAPELHQPFGQKARRELSRRLLQKTIRVQWNERDQFDRILGHVRIDGDYLNRELLEDGLAWRFRNYANQEFTAAETGARQARRGLWSDPDPTPPWEYRDQNR